MPRALMQTAARIRAFFRRDDLDRDFADELDAHLAMLTDDYVRRGMTPEQAPARRHHSRRRTGLAAGAAPGGARSARPGGDHTGRSLRLPADRQGSLVLGGDRRGAGAGHRRKHDRLHHRQRHVASRHAGRKRRSPLHDIVAEPIGEAAERLAGGAAGVAHPKPQLFQHRGVCRRHGKYQR